MSKRPSLQGSRASLAGLSILQRSTGLSPMDGRLEIVPAIEDGQHVKPEETIGHIRGPWRDVLACERVLLNLLSRLSGVATQTARYVSAVKDVAPDVLVCDSRKTTPGLPTAREVCRALWWRTPASNRAA